MKEDDESMSEKSEFAWLIEAPGRFYIGVRAHMNTHQFYWTESPNQALRFHNESQADQTMWAIQQLKPDLFSFPTPRGAYAVEHGWITASARRPDEKPASAGADEAPLVEAVA